MNDYPVLVTVLAWIGVYTVVAVTMYGAVWFVETVIFPRYLYKKLEAEQTDAEQP